MSWYSPRYQIGDAVFFRYVPFEKVDPDTGEAISQTPKIPCTVLSVAHSYSENIQSAAGVSLPRAFFREEDTSGFFYYVRIDQEEAAALGLSLTYPNGSPLTTEVVREAQITGERIEF
jgi:hypothetical protein